MTDNNTGTSLLDEVERWFGRFVAVPDDRDLSLLTLWTISTHLALETYTTPRLLIDSTMPGSGKTTVLDHLSRLCWKPVQAASLSSPALLVRLLEHGIRTVLIDEVDRSLSPNKPGVEDLIGIINSGYRRGATRPVLVPEKGGGWSVKEMPTFAPIAMAGNSPRLPDDTRSRSIRVLLMPDLTGSIEDSDWEYIEADATALAERIRAFADTVRDHLIGATVTLPEGCTGRTKEKWRPLKRVAVAAGGHWPEIADELITRNLAEDADEKEAGLLTQPPGMVLLTDLCTIWPEGETFVPSDDLIARLAHHNPDYWGERSSYGKALTPHRMAKMVAQASKVTTVRPGGRGKRGYSHAVLAPIWKRLGVAPISSGASGPTGDNGAPVHQLRRTDHLHRMERGTPDSTGQAVHTPGGQTDRWLSSGQPL